MRGSAKPFKDHRTPTISLARPSRFLRLSKEGLWIVVGQVLVVLGSLVGIRILTELLDPTAYGELALGMTLATLVNQAVLGPLGGGAARFYSPAAEKGELGTYLDAVVRLVFSSTGAIVLLSPILVLGLIVAGRLEWIAIAIASLILAVVSGYNSIISGIQNSARQRSIVALHQGMESWARFLIAATLVTWLGATSTVAIVGYTVAGILVLASQAFFFRRTVRSDTGTGEQRIWLEQIWKYSWPIGAWGVFTWAQVASDRWALEFFATTQEVGLYAVVFQLGYYPISMASGMAMQFLAPIFYQRAGDASDIERNANIGRLTWRLTGLVIVLTTAAFLTTFALHGEIFQIFVAKEYESLSYLLPWMMLSGGLFAGGQAIALNLMSRMQTQKMMSAKIITALLGITFNFAGAYWCGAPGIVVAAILFAALYFVWMAVLTREPSNSRAMEDGAQI